MKPLGSSAGRSTGPYRWGRCSFCFKKESAALSSLARQREAIARASVSALQQIKRVNLQARLRGWLGLMVRAWRDALQPQCNCNASRQPTQMQMARQFSQATPTQSQQNPECVRPITTKPECVRRNRWPPRSTEAASSIRTKTRKCSPAADLVLLLVFQADAVYVVEVPVVAAVLVEQQVSRRPFVADGSGRITSSTKACQQFWKCCGHGNLGWSMLAPIKQA